MPNFCKQKRNRNERYWVTNDFSATMMFQNKFLLKLMTAAAGWLLLILLLQTAVYAVPADPNWFEHTQPNGAVISLKKCGDEWQNFTVVQKGESAYVVESDETGLYTYVTSSSARASETPVGADSPPPSNAVTADRYTASLAPVENANSLSNFEDFQNAPKAAASTQYTYPQRVGEEKLIVVLVEFSDIKFQDHPKAYGLHSVEEYWEEKVFGRNGTIRSVNDFYYENSNGKFQFIPAELGNSGNTTGVYKVTLDQAHPNTGANTGDKNRAIVKSALQALEKQYTVDFELFNKNGDRTLSSDELHSMFIIAGFETSGSDFSPSVWGHSATVQSFGNLLQPNIRNVKYTMFGELDTLERTSEIGVMCHELGHDIGAPDLYRLPGSSYATGQFDDEAPDMYTVMASGSWGAYGNDPHGSSPTHFDPWNKMQLGWKDAVETPGGTLYPASNNAEYNIIKVPFETGEQYFLIENRLKSGFDMGFDGFSTLEGVLVWRVDDWIIGSKKNYALNSQARNGMTIIPNLGASKKIFSLGDEIFLTAHSGSTADDTPVEGTSSSITKWMLDGSKVAYPRGYQVVSDGSVGVTVKELGTFTPASNVNETSLTLNWTAASKTDTGFTYAVYQSEIEEEINSLSKLETLTPVATVTGTASPTYQAEISGLTNGKTYYYTILVDGSAGTAFPAGTTGGKAVYDTMSVLASNDKTAAVQEDTVVGKQGSELVAQKVTITLNNDTVIAGGLADVDASSWVSNLPAGVRVTASSNESGNVITLSFHGTASEASSSVMEIKIPASALAGNADLPVTQNQNTKFNIISSYSLQLTVMKDGTPWNAHGKVFTLQQGSKIVVTGAGEDATVTFSNVVNGTYDLYDGTKDTGVDVTMKDGGQTARVEYYTITLGEITIENSYIGERLPGSSLTAIYDGEAISSGDIVIGGKELVVTANGLIDPSHARYTLTWIPSKGSPIGSGKLQGLSISSVNETTHVAAEIAMPAIAFAVIQDVTISGMAGQPLPNQTATISFWYDNIVPDGLANVDVSSWFTNLPAGVTVHANCARGENTIRLTFSGTPTEGLTDAMAVVISADSLTSANPLIVEENAKASFSIDDFADFIDYAKEIDENVSISGQIGTVGDQDYVKFTATQTGRYSIKFTSSPGFHSSCELFDQAQNKIGTGSNTSPLEISADLTAGNEYYIGIKGLNYIGEPESSTMGSYTVIVNTPFVPVTGITDVPTSATAGTDLALTGTVAPTNATNQTIVWSVKTAGSTGATITDNVLSTTAPGTVVVTATISNGLTTSSDYSQEFTITVNTAFVPVTGITDVPTSATAGTDLALTGTVAPTNATNKTIVWSVKTAGSTGATITDNVLSTTAPGTVVVTATISNGLTTSSDYSQEFTITVNTAFVPVTGITDVPTSATAGTDLALTGTVAPTNATNQTIVWSVKTAGSTGTTITNNVLSTTTPGTVDVTATISNGLTTSSDYSQEFTITVEAKTYSLTVEKGTGSGNYKEGATITITADAPEDGQKFDHWESSADGAFADETSASTTFTMPANPVTVTATYSQVEESEYSITVQHSGSGTASANVSAAKKDDVITVTAVPDAGYAFKKWEIINGNISLDSDVSETTTFSMPEENVTVKAIFEAETYTVVVEGGTGSGDYATDETVAITANEQSGKKFIGWTIDPSVIFTEGNATTAAAKFTMPSQNTTVTSNYEDSPSIDTTAPILSGGTASRTSNIAGTIQFTTNEDGTAYYIVLTSGAQKPTKEEVKAGMALGKVSGTVSNQPISLTTGAKDVYIVVEDEAANLSDPLKITVAAYSSGGGSSGGGGGGSSGGGGNHNSTTSKTTSKTEKTQTQQAEKTIPANDGAQNVPYSENNGKIILEAQSEMLEKITETAKNNGLATIDVSKVKEVKETELSADMIAHFAKEGLKTEIRLPQGSISFSAGAMTSLASKNASQQPIRVLVDEVDTNAQLTSTQNDKAGTNPVFNISVWAGETQIYDLNGAITVQVSKIPEGISPDEYDLLTIYRIEENGDIMEIEGAAYDNDKISFTTTKLSTFFVSEWINPFVDVKKEDWYYKNVRFVFGKGLLTGIEKEKFLPDAALTRAMLVSILYRNEGSPAVTGTTKFADVSSGQWYSDAIAWASQNGIVTGYGAEMFGTNDAVTREQIVAIIKQYANFKKLSFENETTVLNFEDANDVSDWATDAMNWAVANGFLTGRTVSKLMPKETTSRAESAAILQRFFDQWEKL